MRAAMATAEVGDDVWDEDPTIHRLQDRAAQMVGKEASLFVPSGTMGNLCALLSHTQPGAEVILEVDSHIFQNEVAARRWSPASSSARSRLRMAGCAPT